MPHSTRTRVQQMIQQFWGANEQQSYSVTRDHVLRHYPDLFPPASDDDWDRWQRDDVMRHVQQIFEDMT